MERLPLYILAGGRSRRFGSDKARAVLAGEPMVVRVARRFEPWASEVTVVADRVAKYADLGLTTIADDLEGLGPVGGLAAALADRRSRAGAGWLWLATCDLVAVEDELLRRLLAARGVGGAAGGAVASDSGGSSALRPRGPVHGSSAHVDRAPHPPPAPPSEGGGLTGRPRVAGGAVALRHERWEPMPGLYHTSIEPAVRRYVEGGGRSLWRLLERVEGKAVPVAAGQALPRQVNTVAELEAAERGLGRGCES